WLNDRDCAHLIMPQLLEIYDMSAARWMQWEAAVTEFGFLAEHPTTGNTMQSPYHDMSQNIMTQTNGLWIEIYQIIRENSATEFIGANPQDDMMESLLTMRKSK